MQVFPECSELNILYASLLQLKLIIDIIIIIIFIVVIIINFLNL